MKKSFFLNTLMVISMFLCAISCTHDADSDISDSVTEGVDAKRRAIPVIDIDVLEYRTMEALVEYVRGTPEINKMKVRDKYIKKDLLLKWENCIIRDNDDVEVWTINAINFHMYKPAPLNHSNDGDVEKIILYANCKDYN